MRYLLIPFLILATNNGLRAQVYEMVPRELGGGYAIADGGSITVVDGKIAEWNISITGRVPHTFTNTNSRPVGSGMFEISPDAITFDTTPRTEMLWRGFQSSTDLGELIASCPTEGACDANLGWSARGDLPL